MLRKQFIWFYPEVQERQYQRLVLRLLKELRRELLLKIKERNLLRIDAPEETWSDDLEQTAELVIAWWLLRIQQAQADLTRVFIAISLFNDKQFRRAILMIFGIRLPQSQSLGFDPTVTVTPYALAREKLGASADIERAEPYIENLKATFLASTTASLEQAGRTFVTTTQREIRRKVQTITQVSEMLADIEKRAAAMQTSQLNAARAEIAAINAVLSMRRQVSAGIEKYTWHTRRDERVRDSHRAMEGTIQRWDSPPKITGHPGHDYMCRCWAEPLR